MASLRLLWPAPRETRSSRSRSFAETRLWWSLHVGKRRARVAAALSTARDGWRIEALDRHGDEYRAPRARAVPAGYNEACLAVEQLHGRAGVLALGGMGVADYLILRAGDRTAWRLVPRDVRNFVAEDARQGAVLRDTLLAYVASDLSVKLAAERLFVHPNTAHYRLARLRIEPAAASAGSKTYSCSRSPFGSRTQQRAGADLSRSFGYIASITSAYFSRSASPLQLQRRCQLVASRQPLGRHDVCFLICSTRLSLALAVDAPPPPRPAPLVGASAAGDVSSIPCSRANTVAALGLEHDQCAVERPCVTDRDRHPDQRAAGFDARLRCWRATCSCRRH